MVVKKLCVFAAALLAIVGGMGAVSPKAAHADYWMQGPPTVVGTRFVQTGLGCQTASGTGSS